MIGSGKRWKVWYLIMVPVLMLMVGCRGSKTLTKTEKARYNSEVLKEVNNAYIKFNTLSGKIKVESNLIDKKNALKGQVRIKRDSIIWITLNLSSGFPVAKAAFTQDSFIILDRVNKEVYHGLYSDFNKQFKIFVDFKTLQSILVNQMAGFENEENVEVNEVNIKGKERYNITFKHKDDDYNVINYYQYLVSKDDHRITSTSILADKGILEASYDDFKNSHNQRFPETLDLKVKNGNKIYDFMISFQRVHFDKRLKYNIKIPKKYE